MKQLVSLLCAVVLAGAPVACDFNFTGEILGGGEPVGTGGSGGAGGSGAGGSGGGTGGNALGDAGFPCAAANLLAGYCLRCHGATPTEGAPIPLVNRSQLLAPSAVSASQSYGQRSVVRLKNAVSPMPPKPAAMPSGADLAAFEAWVNGGMIEGSCAMGVAPPDAGPVDAGPAPLTCATGVLQPRPVAGDAKGGPTMAPGLACRACHLGQNFLGQNPGGALVRLDQALDAMGTVFPALHEKDLCTSDAGSGGARVEILDSAGNLKASLTVTPGGNFFGDVPGGLPNPYKARVVRGAASREMVGTQTVGDCNTCHTEQGLSGAPGRIVEP